MDLRPMEVQRGGEIQLILGPMFSGKTTELLRRIQRYDIAQRKCIVIKYAGDTRYDVDCVATHDQKKRAAVATRQLHEVDTQAFDVIGIDELQFFPDAVSFCNDMADSGKIVIAAALNGTYQRKPFVVISELIPHCEKIDQLSAICSKCYESAAFSKRTAKDTTFELIGGSEAYMACCRACYS